MPTSTPWPPPGAFCLQPIDPLERQLHFECFRLDELLAQNNASFPEKLLDLTPLRRTQPTPRGGEELDAVVELLVGRLARKRKLAQAMLDPRGPFKAGDTEGEVIESNWNADRLRTIDRDVVVIPDPSLLSGEPSPVNVTPLHKKTSPHRRHRHEPTHAAPTRLHPQDQPIHRRTPQTHSERISRPTLRRGCAALSQCPKPGRHGGRPSNAPNHRRGSAPSKIQLEGGAPSPPTSSPRASAALSMPKNPDDTEVVPPTPRAIGAAAPPRKPLGGRCSVAADSLGEGRTWTGQRKRTSSISRLKDSAFLLPIMMRTCVMVFPGKFGFSSRSPRKWGVMSLKGISRVCQSVPVWNSAW